MAPRKTSEKSEHASPIKQDLKQLEQSTGLEDGRDDTKKVKSMTKVTLTKIKKRKKREPNIELKIAFDGAKIFCCPKCSIVYRDTQRLEEHLLSHKIKRSICKECGRTLKGKCSLMRHYQEIHNSARPFACPICKLEFKRSEHVQSHLPKCILKARAAFKRKVKKHAIKEGNGKINNENNVTKFKTQANDIVLEDNTHTDVENQLVHSAPEASIKMMKIRKKSNGKLLAVCDICKKRFHKSAYLKEHKRRIHNKKVDTNRELLKAKFLTKNPNYVKIKILTKPDGSANLKCSKCPQSYSDKVQLETHLLKHNIKKYVCDVCGYTFSTRLTRDRHMLSHNPNCSWFCDICTKGFKRNDNFKQHLIVCHKLNPKMLKRALARARIGAQNQDDKNKNISDKQTGNIALTKSTDVLVKDTVTTKELVSEEVPKSGSKTIEIRESKNSDSVKIKTKSETNNSDLIGIGIEKNQVAVENGTPNCSTKPSSDSKKIKILNKPDGSTSLKCLKCPQTYSDKEKLETHLLNHKIRLYVCNVCGNTYPYKSNYNRHILGHDPNHSWFCHFCTKRFKRSDYLKRHLTTAHGLNCKKLRRADVFGNTFATTSSRKLSHDPNRSWFCDVCKKRFKRIDNLKRHVSTVHSLNSKKLRRALAGARIRAPNNQKYKKKNIADKHKGNTALVEVNDILVKDTLTIEELQVNFGEEVSEDAIKSGKTKSEANNSDLSQKIGIEKNQMAVKNGTPNCSTKPSSVSKKIKILTKPDGSTNLKCLKCPRTYSDKEQLETHLLNHKINLYVCDVCGNTYTDKSSCNRHILGHDPNHSWFCDICKKGFKRIDNLKRHLSTVHDLNSKKLRRALAGARIRAQNNQKDKNTNISDKHKGNTVLANFGEEVSEDVLKSGKTKSDANNSDLRQTIGIEKNQMTVKNGTTNCSTKPSSDSKKIKILSKPDGSTNLKCLKCPQTYSDKEKLETHLLNHKIILYVCNVCGNTYPDKKHCNRHILGHDPNHSCVCDVCKKGFKRIDSLKRHLSIVHALNSKKLRRALAGARIRAQNNQKDKNTNISDKHKGNTALAEVNDILVKETLNMEELQVNIAEKISDDVLKSGKTKSEANNSDLGQTIGIEKNQVAVENGIPNCSTKPCSDSKKIKILTKPDRSTNLTSKGTEKNLGKEQLETHLLKLKISIYVCDICGNTFSSRSNCDRHMISHDLNRSWFCEVCTKGFKRCDNLKHHLIVCHHLNPKMLKRALARARIGAQNQEEKNKNISDKHTGNVALTEVNDILVKNTVNVEEKVSEDVPKSGSKKTENCDSQNSDSVKTKTEAYDSDSRQTITIDMVVENGTTHFSTKSSSDSKKINVCKSKNSDSIKVKTKSEAFNGDSKQTIGTKKNQVAFDNGTPLTKIEKSPNANLHIKITRVPDGSRIFNCPICPLNYSDTEKLEGHLTTHAIKRFICDFCGNTFSQKAICNRHKQGHSPNRPFGCEVCKMAFKRKDKLTDHMKRCSNEKRKQTLMTQFLIKSNAAEKNCTNNNIDTNIMSTNSEDVASDQHSQLVVKVAKSNNETLIQNTQLQVEMEECIVESEEDSQDARKEIAVLSPQKTNISFLTDTAKINDAKDENCPSSKQLIVFNNQLKTNAAVKLDKIRYNDKGVITWPPDVGGRKVDMQSALMDLKDWEQRGQKRKRSIGRAKAQGTTYSRKYVVEKIEKMEFDQAERVHLFYVKWEDYHHECNTWEPLEHLDGAEHIVSQFLEEKYTEETIKQLADKVGLELNAITDETLFSALPGPPGKKDLSQVPSKFTAQRKLLKFLDRNIHPSYVRMTEDCKKTLLTYLLVLKRETQSARLKKWENIINKMDKSEAYITVENTVDLEPPPENFCYINGYVPTGNIVIPSTPDTYCLCTDCGPGIKSCCGKHDHNAFTYTKTSKMNVNPGNAIYECNMLCKCGPSCRNRVVQHGRKVPLCIFRTDNGRGWGVKVLRKIACGEFVCEYVGEVIDHEEAERRGKAYDAEGRTYLFDLDYNSRDNLYTVDAAKYGNVSHFINHSCEPNLGVYATWINCQDPNLPRLALFALREVQKGEELTFDYMMNIDEPIIKPKTPEKTGGRQKLDTPEKGALTQSDRPTCKCSADACRRLTVSRQLRKKTQFS